MTAICLDPFCQLPNDGHRHDFQRDAGRVLAHSLSDEVYRRPEPDPYRFSIGDVAKFLVGMTMLYLLVVALIVIGTAAK